MGVGENQLPPNCLYLAIIISDDIHTNIIHHNIINMIIDYEQNKDSVVVSFVDKNRNLDLLTIPMDSEQFGEYTREYHNFVECEEWDSDKSKELRSFKDKAIKLEPSKKFTQHNINYFFDVEIPKYMPDVDEKLKPVIMPRLFSCDIETDITDEYGYSKPELAENAIRSISFTGEELNSVLFIVKNPDYKEFNDFDWAYINQIVDETLGDYAGKYEYKKKVLMFDTEVEMLESFIDITRKYFHCLFGWNFYGYDLQYIFNRCERLNIDYRRISPSRTLTRKNIEINGREKITLKVPAHRIYIDYMMLFKESLIYNNLGKYSLDSIAELILGIKKVSYDGNLRKLYESDYLRFVAYAYADTIIPMLIHHAVNLVNIDFFQSYYTGVPYLKIGQNAISESLIFRCLLEHNKFLPISENSTEEVTEYRGGYVKNPTTKNIFAVIGLDFNSLYPNSMITCGISPEKFVDRINVDEMGYPETQADWDLWNKYKQMGYCLCPTGSIYDINDEGIYTIIEKRLLAERKIFKGHKIDMYLNVKEEIKSKLKLK